VAAVVSRAGPADLTTPWRDASPIARRYVGRLGGRADRSAPDPALLADASPIRWVGPPDVPVLQVQGGRDGIVRPEGTRRLHDALLAAGVDARYEVLPRSGHLFWLAGKRRAEAIEWAWLDDRLAPPEEAP
jgi:dipeptidyl aminopeptidase/acylaminoacyl peptidase